MQTKTIVADFTDGLHIYERIKNDLQNVDVGILGNTTTSLWYKYVLGVTVE